MLQRDAWISACRFPSKTVNEVLDSVFDRVRRGLNDGEGVQRPVVVFDLDSTLYVVCPRTYRILREWIIDSNHIDTAVRKSLLEVQSRDVGYSLRDTFRGAGLDINEPRVEAIWRDLKAFWMVHFFSNTYLDHDTPYAGAADFVNQVYREGAEVVYLTGRDRPGMAAGTLENLHRDGFPIALERTHLYMKDARQGDDLEHKLTSAGRITKIGKVVASFENEPRNVIGLYEMFPGAVHVFVETVCSDHPAPLRQGLYRIRSFKP